MTSSTLDKWSAAEAALETTRSRLFLPAARYLLETGESGVANAVLLLLQASGLSLTEKQSLDLRRALELDALARAYREALALAPETAQAARDAAHHVLRARDALLERAGRE